MFSILTTRKFLPAFGALHLKPCPLRVNHDVLLAPSAVECDVHTVLLLRTLQFVLSQRANFPTAVIFQTVHPYFSDRDATLEA